MLLMTKHMWKFALGMTKTNSFFLFLDEIFCFPKRGQPSRDVTDLD